MSNYRPSSNLSFLSKILEKVVYRQLYSYLNFRIGHSTETALLKLYNDLILAADNGQSSILLCFDFTAAFDTDDHSFILKVLEKSFGVTGFCL